MTVSPDGSRHPAQPPRAADASQSAPVLLKRLRDALAPGLTLLARAWRELVEIERRASGAGPSTEDRSTQTERDRSQ